MHKYKILLFVIHSKFSLKLKSSYMHKFKQDNETSKEFFVNYS